MEFHASSWAQVSTFALSLGEDEAALATALETHFLALLGPNDATRIDRARLQAFIKHVRSRYNPVRYHNFPHAVHVTLSAMHLMQLVPTSYLERVAMFVATLIHDVDHEGVPNQALIRERHPYAIAFNNQSVAEMHSIHLGLQLFEEHDFVRTDGSEDSESLRNYIIEMVLSTDIASFERNLISNHKAQTFTVDAEGKLDMTLYTNKISLFVSLIRACDIAGIFQSFEGLTEISSRLYYEQVEAALRGRVPILTTPMDFYQNQIGFMRNYVRNLLLTIQKTKIVDCDPFLAILDANTERWILEGQAHTEEWEKRRLAKST